MTSSDTATKLRREPMLDRSPDWPARLRRYGYGGHRRPDVGARLVPPYPAPSARPWRLWGVRPELALRLSRWSGWGGPLLVALVAGVLRFWNLGQPHKVIFDETYYAKDAWSLWQFGYEGSWDDERANDALVDDPSQILLTDEASYVVHPPVGKWVIGFGEWLGGPITSFGELLGISGLGWTQMSPFGWRFMTALLGTLSVLMLCRIGRRLFRSTALGCLAGGLLAVDGLHFVMSRTALLDLVLMFWLLAAFGCLLVDRDRARARLAAALPRQSGGEPRADRSVGNSLGLGWRPWRLAAGVCLGLACGTKWNGLYVLAAFGLLTVVWDVGARRTAGASRAYQAVLRKDTLPAFLSLVPVALVVYVSSWAGWFATRDGYFRQWAERKSDHSSFDWIPGPLRSLWHYQSEVYSFHVDLTSGHGYESNPWSWLITGRPVSYFYESAEHGEKGCEHSSGCANEVLALGTPLLWWVACLALGYLLFRWALRRDWRAGAILCAVAAGYLPWFLYQERTIFYFYAVVLVPFLCLAVAMLVGAILGPPGCSDLRRAGGTAVAGVLVLLIVWNFIYFWPIYTGSEISMDAWRARMWLDTWI